MHNSFLIYGANGFVGREIARLAVEQGLQPVLAGRSAGKIQALAAKLGLEGQVIDLQDSPALDRAFRRVPLVLHCAGPFIHTAGQMSDGCLRSGAHYLDLTGEIPVYAALAAKDKTAQEKGVMLMPGVGFDVVPTDCLAVHLQQRLPTATRLRLAFHSRGPAGLPPGTLRTSVGNLQHKTRVRRSGRLEEAQDEFKLLAVDFGYGPRQAARISWGDIFTAYYSTGIPNIEDYIVLPERLVSLRANSARFRPLLKSRLVQNLLALLAPSGSTPEQRAQTRTHVWGEVQDDQGGRASARLHGPEPGVDWTALTALGVVKRVLAGEVQSGYQTPGRMYGADFVLEAPGVSREDVE